MAQRDINLENITFLIADPHDGSRKLMGDILLAIGARDVIQLSTPETASACLKADPVDFLFCDFNLGKGQGAQLVRDLRADRDHPARYIPVIMTCSHTRLIDLQRVRDCGANMLLAKPYSVSALYDRLSWVAHQPRAFVSSRGYCGPDRRVKLEDVEHEDRRSDEMPKKAAAAG
ncbi:MAG: response regulator [Minwuia sp.]|uniref:response regulator n=1 Tax=Minwuia sp. TaxID=2493630 RepID=UPI003A85FD3F